MRGEKKAGRNDPCPCGSGKKHKACCLGAPDSFRQFDCGRCGKHFQSDAGFSEAEGMAEAKRLFPEEAEDLDDPDERVSVCNDCWKVMDIRAPVRTRIVKVQLALATSDGVSRVLVYDWLREFEYQTEKPDEVAAMAELLGPGVVKGYYHATLDKQGRFSLGTPALDQPW